ncbi:Gfo/Idh/MocA family protein [Halovulum sp. GXIMD14793]
MSEAPIRWGVLSAARIAADWVCPAIHMSERGVISAIASKTPGKAAELAAPYSNVTLLNDYDKLLASDQIDAVYIPLPNSEHVEWTIKALEAGKHVLCEKPIALNADEIDRIMVTAAEADLLAAEAFMVVHHPQWIRVRELLGEGVIGALRHVQGAFSFYNDDPDNIRNRSETGGGALRDIGVYPCVTTRFVTGQEPEEVSSIIEWENGVDTTARVHAAFGSFTMDFYVSMRMAPRQRMTFHGTKGFLTVETPFNAKLYGDDVVSVFADGVETRERFPLVDHYREQINAFNTAVLENEEYACPLAFSQGNQRMIDMIYEAGTTTG